MADKAVSWCPSCKRWVPESMMNRDYDEDGRLIRVCGWCLEGEDTPKEYVLDEHHEEVECVYCGSYNTTELRPQWNTYKCNTCGETFRRILI